MATHEVDQKHLGRLVKLTEYELPQLSRGYSISLALGMAISPYMVEARKRHRMSLPFDDQTQLLHDRIIYLVDEGLCVLYEMISPYEEHQKFGRDASDVLVKLRASYYHIVCLLRNDPPILNSHVGVKRGESQTPGGDPKAAQNANEGTQQPLRRTYVKLSPTTQEAIHRDPNSSSIDSENSYETNPWPSNPDLPIKPPPGFDWIPISTNPRRGLFTTIPQPHNFIFIAQEWRSRASAYFNDALKQFQHRPGSDLLRLSLLAEYSAFLWDCLNDDAESRRVAIYAVMGVYESQEPMSDDEFREASNLVVLLGRMTKRTRRPGQPSRDTSAVHPPRSREPNRRRQSHIPRLVQPTSA